MEEGEHRCRRAFIVVVDSLRRFHDEAADTDFAIHFLYIVARGLPVTMAACASKVKGDLRSLQQAD